MSKEGSPNRENSITENSNSFLNNRKWEIASRWLLAIGGVLFLTAGGLSFAHGNPIGGGIFLTAGILLLSSAGIEIWRKKKNNII